MAHRAYRVLLEIGLAALAALVAAVPCAARGTGGFLRDWSICGPIDDTRLDAPVLPSDFAAYPGLFAAEHVWVPATAEADGKLDLQALYPKASSGTAAVHTFFEVPADGTYRLRIGSDDAVRVEVDGRAVHVNQARRAWRPDQDNVKVFLEKGWHRMLVRVVNFSGAWAVSVRVADEKDQPIEVNHQASVPAGQEKACGLDQPMALGERAAAARFLGAQVDALQAELEAALPRLAQMPEGYVTFAEYEGARNLGQKFFEAIATFWREATDETWDETGVGEARAAAIAAARGFSEVLAQETDRMTAALVRGHGIWETLGGDALSRRQFAAATLQIAQLLTQTRQLAARIETERLLMARFENDIRNWRQRDLVIRVIDCDGNPLGDAQVEILQTGHDFLFGCNLFAFRRWESRRNNSLYEKRFRDLFNAATVPMYWSVMERQRGRPDFGPADEAVRWCRDQHIQVKGHPLLWQDTVPRWVEEMKADEISPAVQAHVRQVADRYRDLVDWWDVVQNPAPTPKIGPVQIDPIEAVRWAAETRPRGRLLVNGDDPQSLAGLARRMRSGATRLDGVGIQAHQHEGAWTLDMIRQTLDAAAAGGLPVHVSAVTILGGPEDEAAQAEAVRHFYTAAFAHPKVASITWWDLSDQFAWRNAPAGLVRADLSPKPAYQVLDRLLNHLWRTDAAGRTGDDGRIAVRAFLGRYKITAQHGRRKALVEFRLGGEGPAEVEIVLPPPGK
jgi:GH35 family endo-1,4-beta-xylanase